MSKCIKISDFARDERNFNMHTEVGKKRNERFENLEKKSFGKNINKYDIPELAPVSDIDGMIEFVSFNRLKTLRQRSRYGVHFFIDDYQFDRLWQRPEVYLQMFQECKCVLTPDFSLYTDAPYSMQLWKHYQKQWLGCYMQSAGIRTIPTLGWSDERSFEFCFEGIPNNGTVAVSSVGVMNSAQTKDFFKKGFGRAIEVLTPSTVLFFGKIPEGIKVGRFKILHYPHEFDVKFKTLRDGR